MPIPPARRPRRIIARTIVFGTSALLAAGMLTWTPSTTTGWNQGSAEATLWQLLNGARTNNGLAPLQQHGTLISLARWRSSDMLAKNYFSHTIAGCGCLVYTYYDSNGLNYDWAGENIGWNSGLEDSYSPVRVHERFMASPGHRVNVLDGRFTHGGVGAAAVDNKMFLGSVQNTRMYAELFLQANAAPAPAPPRPAPAPAPPPAGGGSGGGGGSGSGAGAGAGSGGGGGGTVAPAAPAAPKPTPKPAPKPKEMQVDAPRRPASAAGVDGVATIVIERATVDVAARLAADDALGVSSPGPAALAMGKPVTSPTGGMQVAAAAPPDVGFLDGVVGGLLGFLFG
ncbi:MAG: CAP domain-containing protein [Chloroflexi bacterium]|nr:CAP domain-containing protein [Chloroflexota bacterium]